MSSLAMLVDVRIGVGVFGTGIVACLRQLEVETGVDEDREEEIRKVGDLYVAVVSEGVNMKKSRRRGESDKYRHTASFPNSSERDLGPSHSYKPRPTDCCYQVSACRLENTH